MARLATKTAGNHLTIPAASISTLLNGRAAVSVHAWIQLGSINNGVNDNRILNIFIGGALSGIIMNVDGTTGTFRLAGRSISADALQARSGTTVVPTGAGIDWRSVGGVLDYSGDIITPYYQGAAENGGAVTFGASAYTPGTTPNTGIVSGDGSVSTTARSAADIGEISIFDGDIGAAAFAHLAAGAPAKAIPGLLAYWIINGDDSPELDSEGSISVTIVGSMPKSGTPPPVFRSPSSLQVVGV